MIRQFFQHLKTLLCFRTIKISPKSDEREKKYVKCPNMGADFLILGILLTAKRQKPAAN